MGDLVNATGAYLQFRAGLKEQRDPLVSNAICTACVGLPYQYSAPWTFRNRI
jgi:hypothetical protein